MKQQSTILRMGGCRERERRHCRRCQRREREERERAVRTSWRLQSRCSWTIDGGDDLNIIINSNKKTLKTKINIINLNIININVFPLFLLVPVIYWLLHFYFMLLLLHHRCRLSSRLSSLSLLLSLCYFIFMLLLMLSLFLLSSLSHPFLSSD